MKMIATLTVQQWDNNLVIRIPDDIARSAKLVAGVTVELSVNNGSVIVKHFTPPPMTLAEKLAAFDPEKHGGEVMASAPVVHKSTRAGAANR